MAKMLKSAIVGLGRDVAAFVCPWRFPDDSPAPVERGIGRHFAAVGVHLSNAVRQYAAEHPEAMANA